MAKPRILIAAAITLVLLILAGYFATRLFSGPEKTSAVQTPVEPVVKPVEPPLPEPAPIPEVEYEEPVEEPEPLEPPPPPIVEAPPALEQSDETVLLAVADFSPTLAQWLLPEQQIRKWVLAIDLIADGKLPKRYRPLDFPMSAFQVEKEEEALTVAEDNFSRMNALVDTLVAIEPKLLARYYQAWLPLLEKAYGEQGKADQFDQRISQAISQILAVSNPDQQAALHRPSVLYKYVDKELEAKSDVEKLLWRLGPENTEKLQMYLRELRSQLDE